MDNWGKIGDAIRFVSFKVNKAAYGKVTKIPAARSPRQLRPMGML